MSMIFLKKKYWNGCNSAELNVVCDNGDPII